MDKDLLRQGGAAIAWWNTLYKQLPFPSICRLPLQEMRAHHRHYGSFALGQGHTHSSFFQTNPFITGGMRFKSNKSAKKRIAKKKKRKVLRGKIHELKREKRARKASMTPEEILVSRIDMVLFSLLIFLILSYFWVQFHKSPEDNHLVAAGSCDETDTTDCQSVFRKNSQEPTLAMSGH